MTTQDPTAPFDTGHYEQCLEQLDEFFWVFDPNNYCFVYIGPGYARIWERSRQPLYENATGFFEGIHPTDRRRIHQAFCADGASSYNEDYKVVRPDGSVRWIRDRAFPLLDGHQRLEHVAGLTTDLTDLMRTDGADAEVDPPDMRPTLKLDRSQRRYRRLFRQSADAAVLFDVRGYIIEANVRAADLMGFEQKEMVRMHFSSFCPSETLATAVEYWDQATSGQSVRFTLPLLRKDGAPLTAEGAATLIDFGPEYVVQLNLRDVTPREQMAEELEAARDQLAHAQKMELVGQLAGGVAHDFNNLLSVIMMCSQYIDAHLDEASPLRDDTERILQATESAASLVRRLLTFARREVAKPELVDPADLLDSVRPLLERSLPDSVSLTMRLDARMGPVLLAPIELEQIVMNLGINARDAMPDGGELVVEAAAVDTTEDDPVADELEAGPYMRIRVSDTGVGMDERTQTRVFEPFFSTKPKDKGTGLGLTTVLNLVEQNDGVLRLDSEPGEGSTFELLFPVADQQARADARAQDDPQDQEAVAGPRSDADAGATLLVVDDDPQMRQLVRRLLEPTGHTTLMAANPEQALDLLEEIDGQIDLILTDIVMPEMDGPGLVTRARQRWPDIDVLYTSGYVEDSVTRRTLRERSDPFIAKPLTPDALLSKLQDVLRDM